MRLISLLLVSCFLNTVSAQSDTVFNRTDANNLRQGYWKKEWPNGNRMYKAYFRNNKPSGEMRRYYESGRLKAIMDFSIDGERSFARLFYENGNPAAEGRYIGTQKDSVWNYYSFYSKTITGQEEWTKGQRNGMMISYYDNGDISEKVEWKNNKKSGLWEQYFKGNVLKMKTQYTDGKLEGEFIVYSINGNPYITGTYSNNLRHGKWTFFNDDGQVDQVVNYHNGIAAESEKLNDGQQELFRNIDAAQGKYNEPDETDFLSPSR